MRDLETRYDSCLLRLGHNLHEIILERRNLATEFADRPILLDRQLVNLLTQSLELAAKALGHLPFVRVENMLFPP